MGKRALLQRHLRGFRTSLLGNSTMRAAVASGTARANHAVCIIRSRLTTRDLTSFSSRSHVLSLEKNSLCDLLLQIQDNR